MDDLISRQAVLDAVLLVPIAPLIKGDNVHYERVVYENVIKDLPSVTPAPKMGRCKDCKWWKDSDGVYRRGVGAESQCPINRKEVYEGNGYCFMFEAKMGGVEESETWNGFHGQVTAPKGTFERIYNDAKMEGVEE